MTKTCCRRGKFARSFVSGEDRTAQEIAGLLREDLNYRVTQLLSILPYSSHRV
jgi:hypothetical protein